MRSGEARGPGWGAAGPPRLQPELYIYFYRISYKAAGLGPAESLCIINKLFNTARRSRGSGCTACFFPSCLRRRARARQNQPGPRALERRWRADVAARASPGPRRPGPAIPRREGAAGCGAGGAARSQTERAQRLQVRRGAQVQPLLPSPGLRPASWNEVWGGLKRIWGQTCSLPAHGSAGLCIQTASATGAGYFQVFPGTHVGCNQGFLDFSVPWPFNSHFRSFLSRKRCGCGERSGAGAGGSAVPSALKAGHLCQGSGLCSWLAGESAAPGLGAGQACSSSGSSRLLRAGPGLVLVPPP